MDPKPKLSSLPPETLQKLLDIEKRSPANQQLQVLSDIAVMVQELISVADETKADTAGQIKALGAVLTDAREQLVEINGKETPESPDYAKPVVEAISKLEKAIGKMDTKPVVNVPKVDAPVVNVEAPNVDVVVDTKEIARMLKEDIPSAFKEAIESIPEASYPEIPDRWDEVIEWLQNIDTASRMKPQAPTQLKVTNVDGTSISDITSLPVDTYSAVAVDASASGDNTIVAVTNSARLYYVSLSANGANSADVTAIVKIGASEKFKVSLKAGSIFARNIGAGRRYLTGSTGDDIIVNLSAAQTVHVSVEYEDI